LIRVNGQAAFRLTFQRATGWLKPARIVSRLNLMKSRPIDRWRLPLLAAALTFGIAVLLPATGLAAGTTGLAQPCHETSTTVDYKCLFNHELLIICGQKNNRPEYIASFIEKLQDTDVDAVMCCPTMWRANLFPSQVDLTWKKYSPGQPLSKFPSYDYIIDRKSVV